MTTPGDLPTPELRDAIGKKVRLSFGLFCGSVAMALVCAGLVVFAGLPRIFLLPFVGVSVLNGLLHLQLLRLVEEVQDGGP